MNHNKETIYPPIIRIENEILDFLSAEIENNIDEYFQCQQDKIRAYQKQKEEE